LEVECPFQETGAPISGSLLEPEYGLAEFELLRCTFTSGNCIPAIDPRLAAISSVSEIEMAIVDYTRARIAAALEEIGRLMQSEFPSQHPKDAIDIHHSWDINDLLRTFAMQ
jgi:hypothetical protein